MGVSLGALKSKQINRVLKCCRRCARSLVAWAMNAAVQRNTQRQKISRFFHEVLFQEWEIHPHNYTIWGGFCSAGSLYVLIGHFDASK